MNVRPSKSTPRPHASVGEQSKGNWAAAGIKERYPHTNGVSAVSYSGDKSKTTKLTGASGGPAKATYPKRSRPKFGTEKGSMPSGYSATAEKA